MQALQTFQSLELAFGSIFKKKPVAHIVTEPFTLEVDGQIFHVVQGRKDQHIAKQHEVPPHVAPNKEAMVKALRTFLAEQPQQDYRLEHA
ncbi:MAG: hypothetical protein KTR14_03795 [Vampirovibrio sp.]|nr:hypothetical protein [Vampirovibrio sp.]